MSSWFSLLFLCMILVSSINADGKKNPSTVTSTSTTAGNLPDIHGPCRHFASSPNACTFVNTNANCTVDDSLIHYLKFAFCAMPGGYVIGLVLLFLWLIWLFILLGITAEEYFCPSLTVLSNFLRLSPNVAGVTLLALGNGAPDIVSIIAAFRLNKAQMSCGELFGGGLFVTSVVCGTVFMITPFTLTRRPFLRDIIFYISAVSWLYITMIDGYISMLESIGFLILYIVYVVVVVLGRHIYQKGKTQNLAKKELTGEDSSFCEERTLLLPDVSEDGYYDTNSNEHKLSMNQESDTDMSVQKELVVASIHSLADAGPFVDSSNMLAEKSPYILFFLSLISFDGENWRSKSFFNRFYTLFKLPLVFCLNLTVPVVEYDEYDETIWNRYLCALNLTVAPMFIVWAMQIAMYKVGALPVWGLVIIGGPCLSMLSLLMTRRETCPRYISALFALIGFFSSIIWIYLTANEIVSLLLAYGHVIGISDSILGLTVLAIGNSIGDFVSDVTMARAGFPQMAVGAVYGGPLLNVLMGIGISGTIMTASRGQSFSLGAVTPHLKLSALFLIISLASSLLFFPLNGFKSDKRYGIYLMILYATFIVTCITLEIKELQ